MPEVATAREISEYLLEETRRTIFENDFDGFLACFELPNVVETFEGTQTLETPNDVRRIYDNNKAYFARKGVTEMVRTCLAAEFLDADTVQSTHETRIVAGKIMIQRPFPVFSILRRIEGQWRISRSQYAITDAPEHVRGMMPPAQPGPTAKD